MTEVPENPPFYDDLNLSLAETFRLLKTGAANRRSPSHTAVVATIDGDGTPSQRVMIVRQVDVQGRTVRFHTDSRSTKVALLKSVNSASVLVYDPDAKIQLRLSGKAWIETGSADVDAAWEASTLFARRCYMAEAGPGDLWLHPTSGLPGWIEGKQPDDNQIAPARPNFALLMFEFDRLEWLYLANQGHRRALWHWDDAHEKWQGNWLIP
jgi:pyridoxamine 5'-phosphate oxidase